MSRRSFLLVLWTALVVATCARQSSPDDTRASAATFRSDRISVVRRGQGPDLILIPGVGAHRDVWSEVAGTLDDRYTLHLLQVNGFAGLPPGANADGPVSAPVAEEIARYIRETGLQRPALIGHSMGGSIAMMVAARHPGSVGRVMVVDMTPYLGAAFAPPGSTPEAVRRMAEQLRDSMLAPPQASSPGMFERMIPGMTSSATMRSALLQYARESYRPTVANAFHELIVTDLRPELARIDVPMTVLYVIPPNLPMSAEQFEAHTRQSYANVARARIVRVENSNHYIQIDQPGRVVAEVDTLMRAGS
jgi:pimeloyl-ACP methyl ester carboxylesterase